jgi:hypothetical protein
MNPRASLDYVEKRKFLTVPGLELRPLGRPARSQFLHRLRHPGSLRHHRGNIESITVTNGTLPLPWTQKGRKSLTS